MVLQGPGRRGRVSVVDGIAYFGDANGVVYAVRVGDATELWHFRAISTDLGYATVADGMVFMATQQGEGEPSGEIYGIDAATGRVQWRFRAPSGLGASPAAVVDGLLYVPTSADGVYALRAADGQVAWHVVSPRFGFTAAPLVDGQLFVTASNDGAMVDLETTTGAELWRVPVAPDSYASAIVTGGFAFLADLAGTLHAFGPASAARQATPAPVASATAFETALAPELLVLATFDADTTPGLDGPGGMDIGADGLLYLPNLHASEILVIAGDGSVVRRWGTRGTADGQLDFLRTPGDPANDIGGVSVAPDGTVYVADTMNHRIQAFDAQGNFLRAFGSYGKGDGQFLEPFDLDVGPDGSVFVVDDVRDDIQQFTPDGGFVRTIGRHGTGDGELNVTGGIVVAPDGSILNADFNNHRVQAWDPNGTFLWTVGSRTSGPVKFENPGDVGLDQQGNAYVTDNGGIQVFDPTWELIARSEHGGAIAFDGAGDLRLGNGFANQILKLRSAGGAP